MKFILQCRNFLCAILASLLLSFSIHAQVGIGTILPDASSILDLSSNNSGLLIPRMTQAQRDAIIGPATSLLIYQTNNSPGHYAWSGSTWVPLWAGTPSIDWTLSGNTGTNPGTGIGQNFFGTTDNNALILGTFGVERMRLLANGQISINNIAPLAGDRFTVTGVASEFVINSYASGAGIAVYGEDTSNGTGVWGNVGAGLGVYGTATGTGQGVRGYNDGTGFGVAGNNVSTGLGVIGFSSNTGVGVQGQNSGSGIGAVGIVNDANALGMVALNQNNSGVGIAATASNLGYISLSGSGGTFGGNFGSVSFSTNALGTGASGVGNNGNTVYTLTGGSGLSGNGDSTGVYGMATTTLGIRQGGYFTMNKSGAASPAATDDPLALLAGYNGIDYFGGYFDGNQDNTPGGGGGNAGQDYAYVGIRSGGTTYKILGTGSNSTMVNDADGNKRVLFSPEAPEILFEDYGSGKLVNGATRITLDPLMSSIIHVSEKHPLRVFIQLEGECNGVFVSNKSADGFTVTELNKGNSNVPFSWHIVGNRADTMLRDGRVFSKHVDVRFPIGPNKIEHKDIQASVAEQKKSVQLKETADIDAEHKTLLNKKLEK